MLRRLLYLILCVLCVLCISACSKLVGAEDSDTIFDGATVDYSAELKENTPERLAQLSAETYKKMINGDINPYEGFDIMIGLVPEDVVLIKSLLYGLLSKVLFFKYDVGKGGIFETSSMLCNVLISKPRVSRIVLYSGQFCV